MQPQDLNLFNRLPDEPVVRQESCTIVKAWNTCSRSQSSVPGLCRAPNPPSPYLPVCPASTQPQLCHVLSRAKLPVTSQHRTNILHTLHFVTTVLLSPVSLSLGLSLFLSLTHTPTRSPFSLSLPFHLIPRLVKKTKVWQKKTKSQSVCKYHCTEFTFCVVAAKDGV